MEQRDPHLDWMRTVAVLAIVASHAIVPYMEHAPDWYVLDSQRWYVFDGIGLVCEAIWIPALFFVAGAVLVPSLARRGPRASVGARAVRLLVPLPLGLATVVAMGEWLRACRHDGPMRFLQFWPQYWRWDLNHGHLWFLPYLFVLSTAAALALWWRPRAFKSAQATKAGRGRTRTLVVFALGIGLAKAALLTVTGDQTWYDSAVLNVQLSRVPFHVGFFLLGMASALGGWRTAAPSKARAKWATLVGLIAAAGQIFVAWLGRPPPSLPLKLADGLLHAAVATSAVVMLHEWIRLKAKPATGVWTSLTASSYGIYLVHYGPVLGYGALLVAAPWHPVAKYLAVVTASVLTSWLLAELLRRAPGARRIL
ncbi:MAG: acyltransferase family protein [Myxococcales bacterium]